MGKLELSSFDEWLLFELWVFFEIFNQCKEKFGENFRLEKFFEEKERRIKLKIGELEKKKLNRLL
ncbi:MAG: hypothetical protein ABDH49_08935 [Candidatus Hydrothermales bacterium]